MPRSIHMHFRTHKQTYVRIRTGFAKLKMHYLESHSHQLFKDPCLMSIRFNYAFQGSSLRKAGLLRMDEPSYSAFLKAYRKVIVHWIDLKVL